MTESLTTDLSRIHGAFVIARYTAFTFKGKAADVKKLGRELIVRYVLEGSVRRGNNRLRVNVQLVDAETGNHLRAELSPHPDAMDLVFQGTSWLNKGLTPDHMVQAGNFFIKALALDPGNVEAMVGLARVDAQTGAALLTDDWSARFISAEASLTRALSLAPNLAFAHYCLGVVQVFTKRMAQGIVECELALALDQNLARAHALIGIAKHFLGRGAETERHINEAFRLSPRDTLAYRWMVSVGFAKAQLGADAEAVVWLSRGLDANRNHSFAFQSRGCAGEAREVARSKGRDASGTCARSKLHYSPLSRCHECTERQCDLSCLAGPDD